MTDWFTATGTSATFPLAAAPANGQVDAVFLNGILLAPAAYSVGPQSVTLADMPQTGDTVAVKYSATNAFPSGSGTSPAPYGPFPPPGAAVAPAPPFTGGSLVNVADVVNDPDLAQPFTILRSAGSWKNGVWLSQTTEVPGWGVISVAQVQDVEMLAQGDKIKGAMVFHTSQQINTTSEEKKTSSDILLWNNQKYRVLQVLPYSDYGFWSVIATRMDAGG